MITGMSNHALEDIMFVNDISQDLMDNAQHAAVMAALTGSVGCTMNGVKVDRISEVSERNRSWHRQSKEGAWSGSSAYQVPSIGTVIVLGAHPGRYTSHASAAPADDVDVEDDIDRHIHEDLDAGRW